MGPVTEPRKSSSRRGAARTPVLGLLTAEEMAALESEAEPREQVTTPAVAADDAGIELSVIVPARNEAGNLGRCLDSLLGQNEPGFALGRQWELIVVDDASTDGTRAIADEAASRNPGQGTAPAVLVMAAPPLQPGPRGQVTGKNNACWAGAGRARGRWLLFTDADTVHLPGDLSRSLREADRHGVVMLSYSPRQITTGLTQMLVMPLIFSELASIYPPAEVSDPARRVAAANGQFLLVEREAYFAVGGHEAVGTEVLEDVALARNLKRGERRIRFRYAPEAISAHMYRTTAAMVEGWTKNLAVLMPSPVALALWRLLDLLLFFGLPALALALPQLVLWQRAAIGLLWLRTVVRFYSRVGRAHFPWVETAISILGVPLFVFLLLRSVVFHRLMRRVTWKGRSYPVSH